jgi:predicted transcriptional regulator
MRVFVESPWSPVLFIFNLFTIILKKLYKNYNSFYTSQMNRSICGIRRFSSVVSTNHISAIQLFEKSCYNKVDFKINQNKSVSDAVTQFSAFNIGCLAVTNDANSVVGVISERDYINQVAALGRDANTTKVKDICTMGPKIIVAHPGDSLDTCMKKMMFRDIRHLIIMDESKNKCLGMISIRDLIKEIIKDKNETITRLSDFKLGKGAFFGSE